MWYNKKADTKKRSAVSREEHINYIKTAIAQKGKCCPLLTLNGECRGGEICSL